ncbi:MAG: hypothetical protein IIW14_04175 [Kiritimatiellae bacterium]|nr:hypothetical protein [Kiritimatiellia bacterium]
MLRRVPRAERYILAFSHGRIPSGISTASEIGVAIAKKVTPRPSRDFVHSDSSWEELPNTWFIGEDPFRVTKKASMIAETEIENKEKRL